MDAIRDLVLAAIAASPAVAEVDVLDEDRLAVLTLDGRRFTLVVEPH